MRISNRLGLKARADLLRSSLAAWPRRGKRLLEINCGEGRFLSVLWECGFDVTGTEHDAAMRKRALKHVGFRAEIASAFDGYLPFEDDAFDWVILHVAADAAATLENSLAEALRVATGGIAVTFWNSASWPYILHRVSGNGFWPCPRWNFFNIWRRLKKRDMGRLTSLSALPGPIRSWNRECGGFFRWAVAHVPPFGAWCVIRMDIDPSGFVTPLPLHLNKARFAPPEPVLECRPVHIERGHDKTISVD
ncbi:MAG: class I SAM-dependent methyltransferase [Desulfovibrio sp.]|nr:class I SAM-dependent methyltransferase [Desulfovibrio sp.]